MTGSRIALILVSLAVLVIAAQLLGTFAERLRQPRFVGEILAGIVLGPFVLGRVVPDASIALWGGTAEPHDAMRQALDAASWLGLVSLMFISGTKIRRILGAEQRRPTIWILSLGTAVPFVVAFALAARLPLDRLRGARGTGVAFVIVLAAAASVTSIPVISRIFRDLGILHSRFASLILGTAMLEDIGLFAALAVATASAGATDDPSRGSPVIHIAIAIVYLAAGLTFVPLAIRRLSGARWNLLAARSGTAYATVLLSAYVGLATLLDVNVVFAAFLAGFGLVGGASGADRGRWSDALGAIERIAFATLVPLYFVLVGGRLDLGAGFSLTVLAAFAIGTSTMRVGFVSGAARASGFRPRDALDTGIAMNARGGPGIVLATVAFEAQIIAPTLFTALVITAITTSMVAGWWLDRSLRERGELLGEPLAEARVHRGRSRVRTTPAPEAIPSSP